MKRKLQSLHNGAVFGFSDRLLATGNFAIISDTVAPAAMPDEEPRAARAKPKTGAKRKKSRKSEAGSNDAISSVLDPVGDND